MSCDAVDMTAFMSVLEVDHTSFCNFYWRTAEYLALSLRTLREESPTVRTRRRRGSTASGVHRHPPSEEKMIEVDSKLKRRTKQSVHSIQAQIVHEKVTRAVSCQSDQTVEDLLSSALEAFQITSGQARHTYELFLPFGNRMFRLILSSFSED